MQEKRHNHKYNRAARGFDNHSARSSRKAGGEYRRRAGWRFYDAGHREISPFEQHIRSVNRVSGIAGKHIRTVDEPVRASHGKQE